MYERVGVRASFQGARSQLGHRVEGTETMVVSRCLVGVCLLWISGAIALASCDSDQGSGGDNGEVRVTAAPVVGGEPSGPCDWPSTVMVNSCTGTLIHPRVVTTAAHCLTFSNRATFTAGD